MGKKHLKKSPGNGLELDKLEIPTRTSPGTAHTSTADSKKKSTLSSGTGPSRKRQFQLALIAVITTLALLMILATYLKRQDLKVSSIDFKNAPVSDSFLRVGPVTATINDNEIIRLSLDIECENDAVKERLAENDSRIRDKIVSVITAPDTGTLLKKQQYDAIRAKIKENLEKIYGESIGEVYFAELLTY